MRYDRGERAMEAVVRTTRELREDINNLGKRLQATAQFEAQAQYSESRRAAGARPTPRRTELLVIIAEMKNLIASIDDSIPLINLWVTTMGPVQPQQAGFSPSRLLQASMLVNIGDTQYVIDPSRPMQIGPDFMVSLYMLFRGHASMCDGEPYGVEEGQRKPLWQEVFHKARVRLYRIPPEPTGPSLAYRYELQIVEDLDDGRVHTLEDGQAAPSSYDNVRLAGIREHIPVGRISKLFYVDVGRILNIRNEEGASRNPALLLKRVAQDPQAGFTGNQGDVMNSIGTRQSQGYVSEEHGDEDDDDDDEQGDIDRQLRGESQGIEPSKDGYLTTKTTAASAQKAAENQWSIPTTLDPEWMALEVFDDDDAASLSDEDESSSNWGGPDPPSASKYPTPHATTRTSVDGNLMTQLSRMSLASASTVPDPLSSPLPSPLPTQGGQASPASTQLTIQRQSRGPNTVNPTLIERSPFGAIRTSLSLLEMVLRLTSLQEFEQTTHLAIPDHMLRFYVDQSASESGLHGQERRTARAEATRKFGFDPYKDPPASDGGVDAA